MSPRMKKNLTLLQKTLLYYIKLYYTTENFTTWKVIFLQNLSKLKHLLAIENGQSFFISISIDVLKYE